MKQSFSIRTANSKEPLNQDIFFVSTDSNGGLGSLDRYVLETLGYPLSELPGKEELVNGNYLLKIDKDRAVIFIVTVTSLPTEENLRTNFENALREYEELLNGKSIWIPLMGTGAGKLNYKDSFNIIHTAIGQYLKTKSLPKEIVISLPDDIEPTLKAEIELRLSFLENGNEFDPGDFVKKGQKFPTEIKLPQEVNYYQDKYKEIANAKNFIFEYIMSTYELLKTYEGRTRSAKNKIYSSLQYWFDQHKTDDPFEIRGNLEEKEPELVEAYDLINDIATDFAKLELRKNDDSKIDDIEFSSIQFSLIKQLLLHALDDFKFSKQEVQNSLLEQAINYLYNPTVLFNIFTETQQRDISKYFLRKELVGPEFHKLLKEHFSKYGFDVSLRENETCFYTTIIFDDEVRKLWDSSDPHEKEENEDESRQTAETDSIPFHLDYVEEIDRLNREPIAKSLARLLNNQIFREGKKMRHSFMIHLQGAWGDGKSTFLRLLSKHLKGVDENDEPVPEKESKWIVVDFNAWRHQHIDPPWWILMDTIYNTIQNSKAHKKGIWWKEQWWRLIKLNRLYWISFLALLIIFLIVNIFSGFEWLNLKVLISDSKEGGKIISVITSYISIIGSLWFLIKAISGSLIPASSEAAMQFRRNVRDPMDVIKRHFEKVIGYTNKNVAVFIDDLDRCNAEFTVGLLEGIQTLFKEQAVLYVVAGDRHWISTCFENHYEKYKDVAKEPAQRLGHLFLEKAFQLSIRLPKISGNTKKTYWDFILNPTKRKDKDEGKIETGKKEEVKKSIGSTYNSDELIKPENMQKIVEEHDINIEQATDLVLEVMDAKQEDIKHLLQNYHHLIDANPRGVKRLANQYTVYRNILTAEGRNFEREKLFRWLILQNKFPVYTDWLESHIDEYKNGSDLPENLKELEHDEKWKELFFEVGDSGNRVLDPDDIAVFTGLTADKG